MNKPMHVPKDFSRGTSRSFHISVYTQYYIEHKSKTTGRSMSKIVEESILSSWDFKEVINDFFESSKL